MEALEQILEVAETRAASDPPWLAERRRAAAAIVTARGLPRLSDEDWKYTSLESIKARPFRLATEGDAANLDADGLAALHPAGDPALRVVLVNGRLRADLGGVETLPTGVRVRALAAVLDEEPEILGKVLDADSEATLSALNTATVADGILLEIDDDVRMDAPLTLVIVGSAAEPVLRVPRIVIHAGRNARLRVIEQYLSTAGDHGLTNSVTNIELADGAQVFHHRLQNEAQTSAHIGSVVANLDCNALFHSDSIAFGGSLTRVDIDVALSGRGARCSLNGLFAGRDEQHIDHHTTIDHRVGDTHSEELYRGILDNRARGVFNGKVIVRKDAQKISARQASNNLLLSTGAEIDTKPELEIYADDVTCAHGATVGQLDPAALFYLRSRGVSAADARALLIYAFAERLVASIPVDGIRREIEQRFIGHGAMSELLDEMQT